MPTGTENNSGKNQLTPSRKKVIDRAAKKIVKQYGKTLKLLAKE